MSVETTKGIKRALSEHLADLPVLLPVVWPGFDDEDANDAPAYLAVQIRPLPPAKATIYSHVRHDGLLQVDVMTRHGNGTELADEIADMICAHFPVDGRIDRAGWLLRILRPPAVAGPLFPRGWVQTPVTITWTAWVHS